MSILLNIEDLLAYTDWQRELWLDLLRKQAPGILQTGLGPHGDGRMNTVGETIRHIFSAEKRYIERLSNQRLTDTSTVPADDIKALFAFGSLSRDSLRAFLSKFPEEKLDFPEQHNISGHSLMLTPRKILVHIVMHEIRHWAQLATLLRVQGVKIGFQDFLFSPALTIEQKATA